MKNFSHTPIPGTSPENEEEKPESDQEKQQTHEEEEEEEEEEEGEEEEEEEKARCEWDFTLSAVISSDSSASDAIGVVEFDPTGEFLATGGIARKIRIYSTEKSLKSSGAGPCLLDHASACDFYLCTPAKLSSLKWRPGSGSRILGSGDYDGVIMEYDLETRAPIFERDEHGGRRVWSLDYHRPSGQGPPTLGASASDDGTVQMWDPRCSNGGRCLHSIRPGRVGPSPVCCVEFDPSGSPIVVACCADRAIYGFDLRRLAAGPAFVLDRHQRAVTYTRFLDFQTLVSSSVDGSLIMWNTEDKSPIRVYTGHENVTRFVGLSVLRDGGLLSCGSENNRIFVYDKRWGQPVWVRGFERMGERAGPDASFLSGVCWRPVDGDGRCMVVGGGSDGVLQAYEVEKKVMQMVNTWIYVPSPSSYIYGTKEPKMEKDASVADRLARMKSKYMKEGMRTSFEGILLVKDRIPLLTGMPLLSIVFSLKNLIILCLANKRRNLYLGSLVQEHNHPHILLLQIGNNFCKLPGGRLKPGENGLHMNGKS